jgi:23S rRNA (guanosine2251-2'-O)-methyltransferase
LRTKKQAFIIGRQPIVEALRAGKAIERIFIQRNAGGDILRTIRDLAYQHRVPVNSVPEEKLNHLTRANHQGCIAIASLVTYHDLQDVISFIVEKGETPLFLMLDSITDVRNIGAIARSAVCCGAQAIVIPDKGIALLNEEAMKASAGALEHIYICRESSLLKSVDTLRLNGFQVMASEGKAERLLHDCNWQLPTVVVMGSEDKGIQPAILRAADITFAIPMATDFDSFNVSVAAGIILYEASKQRLYPKA